MTCGMRPPTYPMFESLAFGGLLMKPVLRKNKHVMNRTSCASLGGKAGFVYHIAWQQRRGLIFANPVADASNVHVVQFVRWIPAQHRYFFLLLEKKKVSFFFFFFFFF